MTMDAGMTSKVGIDRMYRCRHSPIRTQWFWIKLFQIPTFVSTHLVRHNVGGIVHFVKSNRPDRTHDTGTPDRYTPVNHGILCNAESLITMSFRRLCMQASPETRETMKCIKDRIREIDPDLAKHMVPACVYQGGRCDELRPCGRNMEIHHLLKERKL